MAKYLLFLALLISGVSTQAQIQKSSGKIESEYNDIVHLFRTNQNDEAEYLINRALKNYPKHPDFKNLKAVMIIHSGPVNDEKNDRLAIKFLNAAIIYEPNRAAYYNNRGWIHQFLDNYKLAKKDFDKAAELEPTNVGYQGNRLRLLFIQNKNKEAYALCNKLIKQFPKDGYAYHVRGNLKRDYLHKYLEGNKDIKKGKKIGWRGGINFVY